MEKINGIIKKTGEIGGNDKNLFEEERVFYTRMSPKEKRNMPDPTDKYMRATLARKRVAIVPVTMQRKNATRIALPIKEANTEAVRSFMLDCLVPILAKEFLRRRDTTEHASIAVNAQEPTTGPFGRGTAFKPITPCQ